MFFKSKFVPAFGSVVESTMCFSCICFLRLALDWEIVYWLRAFALEAGRLGSILSRVKPKTLNMVSAVTLAKRSEIKCSAEDEMNRE